MGTIFSVTAAQEDERRNGRHNDAHHQPVHAKGVVECVADGVGLDHVAHEAQRQNDKYREHGRQNLTEFALECRPDVVRRAAGHMAVHGRLVVLRQHGLGIDGRHAEERRHPGPEQCTRAAADQRRGAAGDVAGAHLCRNGRRQRLKTAHALGVRLFAAQREPAEHAAEALAKAAHLHAPQPNRKENACAYEQKQQKRVPDNVAELLNKRGKCRHIDPLFLSHPNTPPQCV